MSEFDETSRGHGNALLAVAVAALVIGVGGLVWSYALSMRLTAAQAELADAKQQGAKQAAALRETDAKLRVATEELGKQMGLTQAQMDARADAIVQREQAAEANAQRLEAQQKQTAQQVSSVSNEVSSVKSDVGGVRTDLTRTRSDLNSAVQQLTSMRGDLSDHASLIARNHDELEILKHRGDRNIYEFTLTKGQRKPVGPVALQLKKTDQKHSRFTLTIFADDHSYEKKDKNMNEPMQFLSGKDHAMLYEVVVYSIDGKNQVTGYLATPKGAPVPANVP